MYNGHKNYNAWNVSLWLSNEECLYRLVQICLKTSRNKDLAARKILSQLPDETPDGVKFSYTNVRLALVGWELSIS